MKRFHVHLRVGDLDQSIRFYSTLFGTEPSVRKLDYAKWMLDDPRVNFAISTRSQEPGIDHLGIQVEDQEELRNVYSRLEAAEGMTLDEGATTCCYAQSEKSWIADPQGIAWETFLTIGESTTYGTSADLEKLVTNAACCTPVELTVAVPEAKRGCGCGAAKTKQAAA
jgi:catechol 2,3-dioxygenase-like lactoylglutathione lyase family enzyme